MALERIRKTEEHGPGEPPSTRLYYAVWLALLILLGLTIGASFLPFGPLEPVIALGIAVTKTALILLYFMHVRYSTRLTWIVAGAGFYWLLIFFGLTLSDYLTRAWLPLAGK